MTNGVRQLLSGLGLVESPRCMSPMNPGLADALAAPDVSGSGMVDRVMPGN